jgi:hypothetical protein
MMRSRRDEQGRRRLQARARWQALRSRMGVVAASAAVALGLGAPLALTAGYGALVSDACQEIEVVDLTIPQIVDVKRRKERWQLDDGPGPLPLSADEVSFFGRGAFPGAARVWFADGTTRLQGSFPRDERCINLDFTGTFDLTREGLTLQPTRVVIGDITVDPWPTGPIVLDPPTLMRLGAPDPANVEHAWVEGGRLMLELYDPWALPW